MKGTPRQFDREAALEETMGSDAVRVEGLSVRTNDGATEILSDVWLGVRPNTVCGVVGESGSGKTTLGRALLGYVHRGLSITSGCVKIGAIDVTHQSKAQLRSLRGSVIGYVPQDPSAALNPSLRVGSMFRIVLDSHGVSTGQDKLIGEVLELVNLPTGRAFMRRYPHQFSGGQQQRLAIALALICKPKVLVLDEPTTGLDPITQMEVVGGIRTLREQSELTIIYISHDLTLVRLVADEAVVLYSGQVVEVGIASRVLCDPRHPYTRSLLDALPDPDRRERLPVAFASVNRGEASGIGCRYFSRCDVAISGCASLMPALEEIGERDRVRCPRWQEQPAESAVGVIGWEVRTSPQLADGGTVAPVIEMSGLTLRYRAKLESVSALRDVNLVVPEAARIGIVGASGSGKTSLLRCIAGLEIPDEGQILFRSELLPKKLRQRSRSDARLLGFVFQNPFSSLNPRHTVADIVGRPMVLLEGISRQRARQQAADLLSTVGLPAAIFSRRPHQLSGGEAQRVAIARALASKPVVLLCDEVTSSLDAPSQLTIVRLLEELNESLGVALVFVSHDLALVSSVTNFLYVMKDGAVVESGPTKTVLCSPESSYGKLLVMAETARGGSTANAAPN